MLVVTVAGRVEGIAVVDKLLTEADDVAVIIVDEEADDDPPPPPSTVSSLEDD